MTSRVYKELRVSRHASEQMAQRKITSDEVLAVLEQPDKVWFDDIYINHFKVLSSLTEGLRYVRATLTLDEHLVTVAIVGTHG